jgi:hypothetical protein
MKSGVVGSKTNEASDILPKLSTNHGMLVHVAVHGVFPHSLSSLLPCRGNIAGTVTRDRCNPDEVTANPYRGYQFPEQIIPSNGYMTPTPAPRAISRRAW